MKKYVLKRNVPIIAGKPIFPLVPEEFEDEYSPLDNTLSDEWQANAYPRTYHELKELEEENM